MWGKYGSRIERAMKFKASIMDSDGTRRVTEIQGPNCLETWESCWDIFKGACIAASVATSAALDLYSAKFKTLVRMYPRVWHLATQADVICRNEEWIHERRRQERKHALTPNTSDYDPSMPWDSVIRATALNSGWWSAQLETPALRAEIRGNSVAFAMASGGAYDHGNIEEDAS